MLVHAFFFSCSKQLYDWISSKWVSGSIDPKGLPMMITMRMIMPSLCWWRKSGGIFVFKLFFVTRSHYFLPFNAQLLFLFAHCSNVDRCINKMAIVNSQQNTPAWLHAWLKVLLGVRTKIQLMTIRELLAHWTQHIHQNLSFYFNNQTIMPTEKWPFFWKISCSRIIT